MLELCKRCTDSRLRSAAHGDVTIPTTRLRFTDRSFTVTGPKAWNAFNALPSRIKIIYFNLQELIPETFEDSFFNHCFN